MHNIHIMYERCAMYELYAKYTIYSTYKQCKICIYMQYMCIWQYNIYA